MLPLRQADALAAIKAHQAETGLAPTVRELAAQLGNTLSSAHALLNHLERQGAISRIPGSPRSIRVPRTASDPCRLSGSRPTTTSTATTPITFAGRRQDGD